MNDRFTLGILTTGHPPEELVEEHSTYPEMFTRMLGTTAPEDWDYKFYAAVDGELPQRPDECDAWLITGSKFGAYEDFPWIHALKDFLRLAYDDGMPLVGICFGHQILAESLGGKVVKSDKGWGVGNHSYHWSNDRPDWLAATDLADKEDFAIQAFHQDQVVELPREAKVLASSPFCDYAALAYKDQAISFQGHPEFSKEYVKDLLEGRRETVLGPEVADKGLATLHQHNDRAAVGAGIVEFLKARQKIWQEKKNPEAN